MLVNQPDRPFGSYVGESLLDDFREAICYGPGLESSDSLENDSCEEWKIEELPSKSMSNVELLKV